MALTKLKHENNNKDKIIEKVKKLYTLSERGYKEEKNAAKKQLDTIVKKHNIDINNIGIQIRKYYEYKYYHTWEKKLLLQIAGKVLRMKSVRCQKKKEKFYSLFVLCTHQESIEIGILYKKYKDLYKEEFKSFFTNFVNKYKLHS